MAVSRRRPAGPAIPAPERRSGAEGEHGDVVVIAAPAPGYPRDDPSNRNSIGREGMIGDEQGLRADFRRMLDDSATTEALVAEGRK